MSNADVYDRVTAKVLAAIDGGVVPWHRPWDVSMPMSMSTNKPYRGINVFLLDGGYWGTYKKIKALGGQVRKGEKSSIAVFWKFLKRNDPDTGEEVTFPMLRHYNVFHSSQADWPDGMPERFKGSANTSEADRVVAAEQLVTDYVKGDGPTLTHGSDSACYMPNLDVVRMPDFGAFHGADRYYSTMFHELGHSTGHASRLNREGVANFDAFGSHRYAREELVAEMTAAMLSATVGIDSTIETSAAYLKHWRDQIASDPRLIVKAAGEAQKAADMVQGIKWEKNDDD